MTWKHFRIFLAHFLHHPHAKPTERCVGSTKKSLINRRMKSRDDPDCTDFELPRLINSMTLSSIAVYITNSTWLTNKVWAPPKDIQTTSFKYSNTHLLSVQERIVESKLAERQTKANSFKHLSSQSERFAAVNCMKTNLNVLTIKVLQLLSNHRGNNHKYNNKKC